MRVELEEPALTAWVSVTVSFDFKLSQKYKPLFPTSFIKPFFIQALIKTIIDKAPKCTLRALSQWAV